MVSLLLVIIASIIGNCIKILKNNFNNSVFKNLNSNFWNISLKKQNKINAYVVLKTLIIILLFLAVIFYKTITDNVPLDVLTFGMSWLICQEVIDNYLNKTKT